MVMKQFLLVCYFLIKVLNVSKLFSTFRFIFFTLSTVYWSTVYLSALNGINNCSSDCKNPNFSQEETDWKVISPLKHIFSFL